MHSKVKYPCIEPWHLGRATNSPVTCFALGAATVKKETMLYLRFKGRYQKEYDALFDLLVPESGEAESIQGELVRAIRKLESDYYRNGSEHFFSRNRGFATFLRKKLRLKSIFDEATIRQIEEDIEMMKQHGRGYLEYDDGEDCYDRITDRVVEYCRARPRLIWRDKSITRPSTLITAKVVNSDK